MPIEHTKGATVITGDSISYFRLCALRSAVGLERGGLKVHRGRCVWKEVAEEFHISKPTKLKVYNWLDDKVKKLAEQQEHRVEEGGRKKREVGGVEIV